MLKGLLLLLLIIIFPLTWQLFITIMAFEKFDTCQICLFFFTFYYLLFFYNSLGFICLFPHPKNLKIVPLKSFKWYDIGAYSWMHKELIVDIFCTLFCLSFLFSYIQNSHHDFLSISKVGNRFFFFFLIFIFI